MGSDSQGQSGSIQEVLERHRDRLMAVPGVHGVAVGLSAEHAKKRCILVYVTTEEAAKDLPRQIEGIDVEIHKTGGFHAQ